MAMIYLDNVSPYCAFAPLLCNFFLVLLAAFQDRLAIYLDFSAFKKQFMVAFRSKQNLKCQFFVVFS